MPQYLTAKQALPAEVTSSVFNRYINILPNPVSYTLKFTAGISIVLFLFALYPCTQNSHHERQATRVLLEDDYEPSSEASRYINANYVKRCACQRATSLPFDCLSLALDLTSSRPMSIV